MVVYLYLARPVYYYHVGGDGRPGRGLVVGEDPVILVEAIVPLIYHQRYVDEGWGSGLDENAMSQCGAADHRDDHVTRRGAICSNRGSCAYVLRSPCYTVNVASGRVILKIVNSKTL